MKFSRGVVVFMVAIIIMTIGVGIGVRAQANAANNGVQSKAPQVLTFNMEMNVDTKVDSGQVKVAAGGPLKIFKLDIPLTQVCQKQTKTVGRLQGWYASMDDEEPDSSFFFVQTATFDNLPPLMDHPVRKGTISLIGPSPTSSTFNQLSVVGGTGFFSNARGVANVTCFEDAPNNFQYDLMLY